jgi:hypothetical protein
MVAAHWGLVTAIAFIAACFIAGGILGAIVTAVRRG